MPLTLVLIVFSEFESCHYLNMMARYGIVCQSLKKCRAKLRGWMMSFKNILPKVPNTVENIFTDVVSIIEKICGEKLNEEYFDLSVAMAAKIARKRPSPLLSGQKKTWAAGIIHALGMVNFLFDKSQSPYLSSQDLCEWFGLGQSTINGKSKVIRDMFKIYQLDPKWCLPSRLANNPRVWMVSLGGYIVDIRSQPRELQIAAYEAGVIPYIPSDR